MMNVFYVHNVFVIVVIVAGIFNCPGPSSSSSSRICAQDAARCAMQISALVYS